MSRAGAEANANHSRGYLPHIVRSGASYFVTFRLADSLPLAVLAEFEAQARRLGSTQNSVVTDSQRELRKRIEAYLDSGTGKCELGDPTIAEMMCVALTLGHNIRYELDTWVIMPNHVHVIVRPFPGMSLTRILQRWKGRVARGANLHLGRTGESFWQPESYDRVIRDEDEKIGFADIFARIR